MKSAFACTLLLLTLASSAFALEVVSGAMLGPRYDAEAFYVRLTARSDWERTYSSGPFRKDARGKLFGIRAPFALFDDEWLAEEKFDSHRNTQRLLAALDLYRTYGVTAITVQLQGSGGPYKHAAEIQRSAAVIDGEQSGSLISAFRPDGSLKESWLERLDALLNAANERGLVVCLTYFTASQDDMFESPEAIVAAARNMTGWLIEKDFRNVVIDVADRWDDSSALWGWGRFIPRNIGSLILDIRDQFNGAAFLLPIGAAAGNQLAYPDSLARLCDVILLRSSRSELLAGRSTIRGMAQSDRPVWIVETAGSASQDEPTAAVSAAAAAAGLAISAPEAANRFPFAYQPLNGTPMPDLEAALGAIAQFTLKKPPQPESPTEEDR